MLRTLTSNPSPNQRREFIMAQAKPGMLSFTAAIYHSPVITIRSQASPSLRLILFSCAVFFLLVVHGQAHSQTRRAKLVAATPPMGWNSWDSYGRTLNEE